MTTSGAAALALLLAAASPAAAQRERPRAAGSPAERAFGAVTPELLRAHQHFLADTLLRDGDPGSRGAAIAARYMAAQFEAVGLKPAAPDGSYFQPVPLLGITPEPSLVLGTGRGTITLAEPEDFVAWPESPDSIVTVDGDVVFAGYGIEAPPWNWDDYKGVPQSGKIVMVLANDPGLRDSTIFNGRTPTVFGRWTTKLEQAAKMGALGVLLVHTGESTGTPWNELRGTYASEQFRPAGATGRRGSIQFAAWVREDVVRRILAASGRDFELLLRRAQQREFSPIPVGLHAAVDIRSHIRHVTAVNVIARTDWTDPAGAPDAIVLSAPIAAGDSSRVAAVSALLTAAAGFARLPPQLHPLLLVASAGSVGVELYVSAPAYPLARTAAAIGVVARRSGAARGIAVRGAEYSSLGDAVALAGRAENVGLAVEPPAALYDSGVFPFARAGIPTIETAVDGSLASASVLLRLGWSLMSGAQSSDWLPGSPLGGEPLRHAK